MKRIPVTIRDVSYGADVDDEDFEFLSQPQFRWTADVRPTVTYANTNVNTEIRFKCVALHRMVIGDAKEEWQLSMIGFVEHKLDNGKIVFILPDSYRHLRKITVDHVDGNGLNNTKGEP